VKTPMDDKARFIDSFGPILNQAQKTQDASRDGMMANRSLNEKAIILLVEDSAGDVALLKRAFSMAGLQNDFMVARSGREAIEYFAGGDSRAHLPVPTHVLLDLNLPGTSGLDVLAWIRTEGLWSKLPVIVFTHSALDRDISLANQLGIDAYLSKGIAFEDTRAAVARIAEIWNLPPMASRQELASQVTDEQF
jgi:CheY-like chemotaxis protein